MDGNKPKGFTRYSPMEFLKPFLKINRSYKKIKVKIKYDCKLFKQNYSTNCSTLDKTKVDYFNLSEPAHD